MFCFVLFWLFGVFLKSRGVMSHHLFFSLGTDRYPGAILCLFTSGPHFCFMMPERRGKGGYREGGKDEEDAK